MREILFKAKATRKHPNRAFNNSWVAGNLILTNEKAYIHPIANLVKTNGELGEKIVMHEVIRETISQYTGMDDKNDNRIWENDIVKLNHRHTFKVVYEEEDATFCLYDEKGFVAHLSVICEPQMEKLGNIFDSPELLEVEK